MTILTQAQACSSTFHQSNRSPLALTLRGTGTHPPTPTRPSTHQVYPNDCENLVLVLEEAFRNMGVELPLKGDEMQV